MSTIMLISSLELADIDGGIRLTALGAHALPAGQQIDVLSLPFETQTLSPSTLGGFMAQL